MALRQWLVLGTWCAGCALAMLDAGRELVAQEFADELGPQVVLVDPFGTRLAIGAEGRRDWGPEQATGMPDTAGGGDQVTAWASATFGRPFAPRSGSTIGLRACPMSAAPSGSPTGRRCGRDASAIGYDSRMIGSEWLGTHLALRIDSRSSPPAVAP